MIWTAFVTCGVAGADVPFAIMLLRSLLLCHDHATVQLISRGFKEFSVDVEACSAPEEALHKFTNQRFDAVVIDDSDHAAATQLIDKLKLVPAFKNSTTIVLVDPKTALGVAFNTGSNLAIYKPLTADRLRKSLRAMHNLIGRSRQRKFDRIAVKLPARIRWTKRRIYRRSSWISAKQERRCRFSRQSRI